jgi:hypothetical protein
MKKAAEYRRHALECRRLASGLAGDGHREQLLEMAATWDRMAEEREKVAHLDEERSFRPKPVPRTGHD